MPKLTINGLEIEVEKGTSILQAAEQLGVEIPRFCYHDRLSVPANCRMCLVEVEGGPPKPVASCAMACADNMVVKTESEMVKKARKGVMEMLLINHPLDCPICDQGGECDLQDQAVAYGFDRSRFHENKRAVPDPELGPLIKTSMNRCINCTRCVRFAEEIAGTPVMGQFHRGEDVEIGTFIDQMVKTELSGNLIDICPVGALLSKPYNFKARPWELRKTESIDVNDALGCNICVDARGREVMRILPRLHEDINEEWIDDRARFSYDGLNHGRLDRPWIRDAKTGKLSEGTWDDALNFIAEKMKGMQSHEIAGLVGDLCDIESIVALKDLLTELGSQNMECRTDGANFDAGLRAGYLFNSTIAGIDQADVILLVGTNPRFEAAVLNARIRKVWLDKKIKIGVIGEAADLTYSYDHLGTELKDLQELGGAWAESLKSARNPMLIVGSNVFVRPDGPAVHKMLHSFAESFGLLKDGWNGFNILHRAASRVGALDVGFVKEGGSLQDIIDGTKKGAVRALYMLGADEFDAKAQIGWTTFVIYQGHHGDRGAARADVILPGAAFTEKEGLYVNTEGRVQRARRASFPPGEAREDWAILRALADKLGVKMSYDTHMQLRERIFGEFPDLKKTDQITPAVWGEFGGKGKVASAEIDMAYENFYLANAICRASETMHKCVEQFSDDNYAEAAE
ncbi:MAG: NADH-quinone oxidoreductase subunit NuoG [Alphaproteobacteria bacterium]